MWIILSFFRTGNQMGRVPSCSKWVPEELLMLLNLWVTQESRRAFPKQADNKINRAIDMWQSGGAGLQLTKASESPEQEDSQPRISELPWRICGQPDLGEPTQSISWKWTSPGGCFWILFSISLTQYHGIIASFPLHDSRGWLPPRCSAGSPKALAISVLTSHSTRY